MKKLIAQNILMLSLLGVVAYAQQDDFMIPEEDSAPAAAPLGSATAPNELPPADALLDPSVPANANAGQDSLVVPQGTDPLLEGFFEDTNYSPQDKRDPFFPYLMLQRIKIVNEKEQVPTEPLQRFALNELKVVGIIWDVGKPKALILDPQGKSYIVTQNAKVGKEFGYIAAIREGEVLVVEEVYDPEGKKSYVTKILKLTAGTTSASVQ